MSRLFLFLRAASRKITLMACNCCCGVGGKNAIGVSPAGTNPAAIAWIPPAVCAEPDEKNTPPPTKE